jgi:hypothetical protein
VGNRIAWDAASPLQQTSTTICLGTLVSEFIMVLIRANLPLATAVKPLRKLSIFNHIRDYDTESSLVAGRARVVS